MGYQPRIKSPRGTAHGFKKPLRERKKERKRRRTGEYEQEKRVVTEEEVCGATLKRLHTLGNQRFGSSPYSEHYNRWLADVEVVLAEFEAYPSIKPDEEFKAECTQTLGTIRVQLEERRKKEAAVDQEVKNLAYLKKQVENINAEYTLSASTIKARRKAQTKRLNSEIEQIKKEQDIVIKMKTGFWRGISKKKREEKEIALAQQLNDKQTELELLTLNSRAELKMLREDSERKREPVVEQIKGFKRKIRELETDGSLEERWFACEALTDAVNSFLQRKAVEAADPKSPL
ncbi:MAG: hypothetical protein ACQCN6_00400 [Candidatus Bathyarchaeia archaeon]|jgi:hypothetical protein